MWLQSSVDMVHIGGTRSDNDTDLRPRPADAEKILYQAYRVMPSLRVRCEGPGGDEIRTLVWGWCHFSYIIIDLK